MYSMETANKILDFIREHKVSTTEIGDCLNKTGAIPNCLPINRGIFKAGIVHYVYAHSNSNWPVHEQLIDIPEDRVIYVDAIKIENRALFGELVTMYVIEKKKSIAIVTQGLMRDAAELISGNWPMWCGGITPEGCFNIQRVETPEIELIAKRNREYYEGSIAVCDDCGVVIIPKEKITEEFYDKIVAMEEQEKKWFECVRDRDWNTFETVCLKKYLEE